MPYIYKIYHEKNNKLFKKQQQQPIEISELSINKKEEFTDLKKTTLNYNLILNNENYTKYFMIEKSSIDYLKKLNQKRNELHLYMSEQIEFGDLILENLSKLKRIVEIDFAVLHNFISNQSEINYKERIKVNY